MTAGLVGTGSKQLHHVFHPTCGCDACAPRAGTGWFHLVQVGAALCAATAQLSLFGFVATTTPANITIHQGWVRMMSFALAATILVAAAPLPRDDASAHPCAACAAVANELERQMHEEWAHLNLTVRDRKRLLASDAVRDEACGEAIQQILRGICDAVKLLGSTSLKTVAWPASNRASPLPGGHHRPRSHENPGRYSLTAATSA